jgi:hypothetical protein
MPAQTLVFSEQFTSTCVFRTIGLLECFTLSLGCQWSALSTLFPGLDFLTALSLSLSFHPSESSSLPLPLLGSLSEAHSHSLVTSLSLSLARSLTLTPPPPFIFFLFWVLSRSLAFFLVHSLSPGSGSSFTRVSHSYLSGLTVSLARSRTLSLSGLPFLWVRFPHSVTQSFFTQSSLLNLSILISQVSLSLSLAPRVPHSRSLNLELPELFVRLSSNSILLLLSLTSARARTLSLARSRALISLPRSHSLTYLAGALALAHPRTRAPFLSRARERSLELYFELYFELLSLTCSGSC